MSILKPPCEERCSPLDTFGWVGGYKWARSGGGGHTLKRQCMTLVTDQKSHNNN